MLRLVERLLGGTGSTRRRAARADRDRDRPRLGASSARCSSSSRRPGPSWSTSTIELRTIESQIANVNLAPPSEPTLMLTIEVKIDGTSSTIVARHPAPRRSSRCSSGCRAASTASTVDRARRRRGDAGAAWPRVDVEIRAEVASTDTCRSTRCSRCSPATCCASACRPPSGVRLFAGHVPAHRAQPGRNGNCRAVQVIGRLGEAVMTTEEALIKLADSTGDASRRCSTIVSSRDGRAQPGRGRPSGDVAAAVDPGARRRRQRLVRRRRHRRQHLRHDPPRRPRLAAAMMGMDATAVEDSEELSELDLSAAGEAMNQMMAAAAGATAHVLGEEVEISPAGDAVLRDSGRGRRRVRADAAHDDASASRSSASRAGCVQLVPERVRRPHDARARRARRRGGGRRARQPRGPRAASPATPSGRCPCGCGPSSAAPTCPSAAAVGLATGAVVELDRAPDDPVDLFVNGRRFGTGRLLLVDDEWAVRIESVLPAREPSLIDRIT